MTTPKKMPLRPCPFCDATSVEDKDGFADVALSEHLTWSTIKFWQVDCYKCECRGPKLQGKAKAINAWNGVNRRKTTRKKGKR